MTVDEDPISCEPVETALQALEKRDAVAAASAFAVDGRFVDPQFPETEYRGQERVREALEWALTNLVRQPEFEIRHFLEAEGTYALEVEARHAGGDDGPDAGTVGPDAGTVGAEAGTIGTRKAYFVDVADDGITCWRTYHSYASDEGSRPGHEVIR